MSAVKDRHVDDPVKVGRRVAERRAELELSQRALGDQADGISTAYISRVETGDRTPSVQALEALAGPLKTTAHWLAWGEADPRDRALELARELVDNLQADQPTGDLADRLADALDEVDGWTGPR